MVEIEIILIGRMLTPKEWRLFAKFSILA